MKRFAALYEQLDGTRATSRKLTLMRDCFKDAADADAAWMLYFLSGRRLKRVVAPARLRAAAAQVAGIPDWMLEASHAHVGDLAETIALLTDDGRAPDPQLAERGLAEWVDALRALREAEEATLARAARVLAAAVADPDGDVRAAAAKALSSVLSPAAAAPLVADAVGSRVAGNKAAAIDRMQRHGAEVVTTEMVLFEWLRDSMHPRFRDVQKLIR